MVKNGLSFEARSNCQTACSQSQDISKQYSGILYGLSNGLASVAASGALGWAGLVVCVLATLLGMAGAQAGRVPAALYLPPDRWCTSHKRWLAAVKPS